MMRQVKCLIFFFITSCFFGLSFAEEVSSPGSIRLDQLFLEAPPLTSGSLTIPTISDGGTALTDGGIYIYLGSTNCSSGRSGTSIPFLTTGNIPISNGKTLYLNQARLYDLIERMQANPQANNVQSISMPLYDNLSNVLRNAPNCLCWNVTCDDTARTCFGSAVTSDAIATGVTTCTIPG